MLTDAAWNDLKTKASDKKLSVSEYVERWIRESWKSEPP